MAQCRVRFTDEHAEHMREEQRAAIEGALDDLQALVRMLWAIGGYMTPAQQHALRAAMARLAEHGRTVET